MYDIFKYTNMCLTNARIEGVGQGQTSFLFSHPLLVCLINPKSWSGLPDCSPQDVNSVSGSDPDCLSGSEGRYSVEEHMTR